MAPARRLRSILARVFRYLADAVCSPVPARPVRLRPNRSQRPQPETSTWFAVVRERAPELLDRWRYSRRWRVTAAAARDE